MDQEGRQTTKFLIVILCAGFFCSQGHELSWAQGTGKQGIFHAYSKPMPAPEFSLENLEGKKVDIRDYRGKVILLNFWATWCPNCLKETPSFEKLFSQYHSQGLILFRIGTKESRQTVANFMEKHRLSAPVLLDRTGKVGRLFGLWAHPTSYLIDRQGMVRYRAVGMVDWNGAEAMRVIDQLLKEL